MLRKDEKCKNLPVDNVDNFLMDSAQVCDFVCFRETEVQKGLIWKTALTVRMFCDTVYISERTVRTVYTGTLPGRVSAGWQASVI